MPFVQRIVEPKYLSRTSLHHENGDPVVTDYELEAVTNNTLSNALRQLASLVLVANDIFTELTKELQKVSDRSTSLKLKIGLVDEKVSKYDPKKVPVPEGDISTFAMLREHYVRQQPMDSGLFSAESRPTALQALYEAAAKTPVHAMRQMDRWRRDGRRSSRFFLCTPVLGAKRRKIRNKVDIDIETRMPAAVEELRRWTSTEAIGDVTVTPDCVNRIAPNVTVTETDVIDTGATSGDEAAIDHKLPSPEEQLQVLALKFPAEIVAVDVSGRRFDRMTVQRRSLLHSETTYEEEEADGSTVRRRTRSRKPRGKRRNTLAGTDQKEIRDALTAGDEPSCSALVEQDTPETPVTRSKSTDILRSKKGSPPDGKKSHFNTLKQWGRNRLKMMNRSSESKVADANKTEESDEPNIYETVTMRRRKNVDKNTKPTHERKTSYSSSEKSSSISLPIPNIAVKLRESSAQRRQRRNKDEQHSSSGNWSASSESGRASIGSEITTTTHPKSTTSAATSINSLNQHAAPSSINSRRRFPNTSTSSSVTSEGTLTPDIHDVHDDGETSSVYSCDTEGYYTSFHLDSGLKTLKEEELGLPMTPLHVTNAFSNSSGNCTVLTAENEYELFGRGSTSTTTSSAGTVCTTLRASESYRALVVGPAVPERKSSLSKLDGSNIDRSGSSSLERDFGSDKTGTVKRSPASNKATVVAVVHKQSSGDISPDSGHNTSSSPIESESISSPNGVPSGSEFEFSESSDLEGMDRIERIRIKTTINSSRIPSMCVITPPHSDDESVKSVQHEFEYATPNKRKSDTSSNKSSQNNLNIPSLGSKNVNRPKLNLPLQPTETDLDTLNYAEENKNSDTEVKPRVVITPVNGTNKLQLINVNPTSGYATVETIESEINTKTPDTQAVKTKRDPSPSLSQPIIKATLMPLNNMFGKLKSNFTNLARKSPNKPVTEVDLFDSGDYVTIADVRNNNEKAPMIAEVHYANDVVKKDIPNSKIIRVQETEYISLSELPMPSDDNRAARSENNSLERSRRGARVTLDAEGKVVYSSDSLRRRKGAHTTFEPGPFVKDISTTPTASPLPTHRTPKTIRPVSNSQDNNKTNTNTVQSRPIKSPDSDQRPLSPQLNKFVIRANPKTSSGITSATSDCVRMRPSTIVTPTHAMSPKLSNSSARGAYVNMQEDRSIALAAHEEERALSPYKNHLMHRQPADQFVQRDSTMGYQQIYHRNDDFMIQRNTPQYKTLPTRVMPNMYNVRDDRSMIPEVTQPITGDNKYPGVYESQAYKFSSLPRQQSQQRPDLQINTNSGQVPPPYQLQQFNKTVSVPQIPNFTKHNQVPFNVETSYRNVQNSYHSIPQKTEPVVPSKTPMGTHFFSPISKSIKQQENQNESFRISPIDPRNTGGFKSSTPSRPNEVSGVNLNNKLLSPKKSTMSNDELYAMIHKSKKKMNIKTTELDRSSPVSSVSSLSPGNSMKSLSGRSTPVKQPETGYFGDARSRNSWSPNNEFGNVGKSPTEAGSRQSWACSDRIGTKQTSRLDFKKLLLQHGNKTNVLTSTSGKLSAVEQLKLTKNQPAPVKQPPAMNILDLSSSPRSLVNRKLLGLPPGSPKNTPEKQRSVPKLLSPRSNWRFTNPRSDVLSSTIHEDCREDESPNSSAERNTKTVAENRNIHRNMVQDSIAERNTNIVADNEVRRTGFRRQLISSNASENLSRSQYIQAQRAHFFTTSPEQRTYNTGATFLNRQEGTQKCPSPPTLETAL